MDQHIQEVSPPKNIIRATSFSSHPVHKTLATAANLAHLLPTGTVLAFRTLAPSFSNKGVCQLSNKCLTAALLAFCSITCFVFSFTDSLMDSDGKVYYGFATFKGLHIFNHDAILSDDSCNTYRISIDLSKFRITLIDFFHAFVSVIMFLVFAFSDDDVANCFFPDKSILTRSNLDALVMNLPLAAGVLASFLFVIFPTTRRGIGYADERHALVRIR